MSDYPKCTICGQFIGIFNPENYIVTEIRGNDGISISEIEYVHTSCNEMYDYNQDLRNERDNRLNL